VDKIKGAHLDEQFASFKSAVEINTARQPLELLDVYEPSTRKEGCYRPNYDGPFTRSEDGGVTYHEQVWTPERRIKAAWVPKVLVQVVPRYFKQGAIELVDEAPRVTSFNRDNSAYKTALRLSYGTVIGLSPRAERQLSLGQDVMFPAMLGVRYLGDQITGTGAFKSIELDMVKVLNLHPMTSEIIGVVTYAEPGLALSYRRPGGHKVFEAVLVEEHVVYGDHYLAAHPGQESDEASWFLLPKKWLVATR